MKAIIVDSEAEAIRRFEQEAKKVSRFELTGQFTDPDKALAFLENSLVEAVFLETKFPDMDGIELGKQIRKRYPDIVLIYITADDKYVLDALKIKADYYLLKPYSREDVKDVMERAVLLARRQRKRVYFRTFGRFDLFIDEKVIYIKNAKAKELLALCVDHKGGTVTLEEAIDKLWEHRVYDDRVKNLYRKAVMDIKRIFWKYNVESVFFNSRGACNVDYMSVDCDYFSLLEGRISSRQSYVLGHYLSEYSWAEETAARIEEGIIEEGIIEEGII